MSRVNKIFIIIFLLTFFIHTQVFAQSQNPLRKLARGVSNTLGGLFWETCSNMEKTTVDEGIVIGTTYGLGKGILKGIGRTVVGIFETVTFILPIQDYEPILTEPEFPFQPEKSEK